MDNNTDEMSATLLYFTSDNVFYIKFNKYYNGIMHYDSMSTADHIIKYTFYIKYQLIIYQISAYYISNISCLIIFHIFILCHPI